MADTQAIDKIEILFGIGIFSSFAVFAVVMWFIRQEMNKKKIASQKDTDNSQEK
jgi:hypothetical protein